MLMLYVKTNCPWCRRVLEFAEKNGITFDIIKNRDDEGVRDELIERGGKSQFPYLVDVEEGVEMYESADIIEYLGNKYHTNAVVPEVKGGVCLPDFE